MFLFVSLFLFLLYLEGTSVFYSKENLFWQRFHLLFGVWLCFPLLLFFTGTSQILFFLYFSLSACFPTTTVYLLSPPYMPGWYKIDRTSWGCFSTYCYIYPYSFLSVDMLSQNFVIPWKTQPTACNSARTISIIPIVFKNIAISIYSHIKWNWWPAWRPESGECALLTLRHPSLQWPGWRGPIKWGHTEWEWLQRGAAVVNVRIRNFSFSHLLCMACQQNLTALNRAWISNHLSVIFQPCLLSVYLKHFFSPWFQTSSIFKAQKLNM